MLLSGVRAAEAAKKALASLAAASPLAGGSALAK